MLSGGTMNPQSGQRVYGSAVMVVPGQSAAWMPVIQVSALSG
jgi:hypothetical protein